MGRTGFWAGLALVGAASAATGSVAAPPTGANAGAPVQPGSWGRHGWQAGAGATPTAPTTDASPAVAYRHLAAGETLPTQWQSATYTVSDWHDWGLTDPGAGRHWVRYYDDAVLVDGTNKVAEVRQDAGWARATPTPATTDATTAAPVTTTPVTEPPRVTTVRTGPNTVVTTETRSVPAIAPGSTYDGRQVVSSTPGTITTTTTTTTEYPAAPASSAKPASRNPSSGK
jgi:Ni/Co efflux regulator RcnB